MDPLAVSPDGISAIGGLRGKIFVQGRIMVSLACDDELVRGLGFMLVFRWGNHHQLEAPTGAILAVGEMLG